MKILLADNNDSFTYNLYHHISAITNHSIFLTSYKNLLVQSLFEYDAFVISPGPGHPDEYKDYIHLIRLGRPIFGVCMGMQVLNSLFGGNVERLKGSRHGITVETDYKQEKYNVAVYNSLYCSYVPEIFEIFAEAGGVPMGIRHRELPFAGVQFHPESFMTEDGDRIINDVFSSIGII